LDPLATGLLILCTGRKTKEISVHQDGRKTYTGTITLGATRPSFDMETEIDKTFEIDHIDNELLMKAKESLTGEYLQTPPIFSAKRIDGKRAYDLARKGADVKMNRNLITVHSFEITRVELPEIDFEIVSSKGTYIRSIANDFGVAVNSGAYLSALRRTQSGDYNVDQAIDVKQFTSYLLD
jgi:tRNA pseudouridine55 synthase